MQDVGSGSHEYDNELWESIKSTSFLVTNKPARRFYMVYVSYHEIGISRMLDNLSDNSNDNSDEDNIQFYEYKQLEGVCMYSMYVLRIVG